ncbi:MAG: hypothetical protein ACTSQN_12650 [Candidatus Heimdallarchaeota archaeon]
MKEEVTTQLTLIGDEFVESDDKIIVIWRKVIEDNIQIREITKSSVKRETISLLNDLISEGKHLQFGNAELDDNKKEWIEVLLKRFSKDCARFLLRDFAEELKTRQRQEEKHTVFYFWKNIVFICHSTIGEKTTTEQKTRDGSKFDVVPRFVDKDNVDRFVAFRFNGRDKKIIYKENKKSEFFYRWLGIEKKEAQFKFSDNRFFSNFHGVKCIFEFTDEEVDEILLQSKVKYSKKSLEFPNGQKFPIERIKSGRAEYSTVTKFIDDYKFRKNRLDKYQDDFLRFTLESVATKFIDSKLEIERIKSSTSKETARKKDIQDFVVSFRNQNIEIATDFLNEITEAYIENNPMLIFHAGEAFSNEPLIIGSLSFFNKFKFDSEKQKVLTKLLNVIEELRDIKIHRLISIIIFNFLSKIQKPPISYLFSDISNSISHFTKSNSIIIEKEKPEIEYKAQDWFIGDNEKIIKRFSEDIIKKLKLSEVVCYLIGIDEKLQFLDPIPNSRFDSQRLEKIKKGILSKLNSNKIELKIFQIDPISISDKESLLTILCSK